MRYVGIDVGKQRCRAAVMDGGGSVVEEFTFTNNFQGIEDLASRLTVDDRVVMESTGSVWTNLYNCLDDRQISVVLANPLKTKAIASARIKSDNHDEPFNFNSNRYSPPQEASIQPFEDYSSFSRNSLLHRAFPIQDSGLSPYRSSREQALCRLNSS
jgi:hypothetical protein